MLAVCCILSIAARAQAILERFPDVGRQCPEFTLRNIKYYPRKQSSLKDFRGKWLVLDFWNKFCGSCVASFPSTNAMQKEFGDKVQFMLVGKQDPEQKIEPMYDRFREREHLILPSAFDSTFANQWCIYNCPHIVIIDDKGVVQGITYALNREQMAAFLRGEHPKLGITYHSQCQNFDDPRDYHRTPFDDRKPYSMEDNGGHDADFIFRSILTHWNQKVNRQYVPSFFDRHAVDSAFPAGYFQVLGLPLEALYKYAYYGRLGWSSMDTAWYGKYFPRAIIETADSSVFHFDYTVVPAKNVFCYSMIMPAELATEKRMQEFMQRDLQNYFGFEVSIETRKFSCLKLIATDEAPLKLRTKGEAHVNQYIEIIPRAKYRLQNATVGRLIRGLGSFGNVILDETGIKGNIDITIECVTEDDILKSLQENGLSLVPTEKEMKVLVIRDPKVP